MSLTPTLVVRNLIQLLTFCLTLSLVTKDYVVRASPCIAFDIHFNLFAFGLGGKDFLLGTQDKWSSNVNPTDITTNGRPLFNGERTTCYLAQFFNAIYVLNGDQSSPQAVYIYDVAKGTWSTQAVSPGGPSPASLVAILDHDTNVFYAVDNGTMFALDLGTQVAAKSSSLSWNTVGSPAFLTPGYKPTMALAQNHIHFIGVPNTQPGSAKIFVIHFSFFQPDAQTYPSIGGQPPFPSTHGQTTSFFQDSGVQQEFAFIPDDGSATYVINVENNSTLPMAGPSDKSSSTFAASIQALVQLTSSGSISFLPYTQGNNALNKAATWSKINVQGLPVVSNSSTNGTGSGSGNTGGNSSATATASGTAPSKAGSPGNNALQLGAGITLLTGTMVALLVLVL